MSKSSKQANLQQKIETQNIFVEDDLAITSEATDNQSENPSYQSKLKTEQLTYINEMLDELRKMSISIDEPMISYLIEMAYLEANTALNVKNFSEELDK